MLIHTMKKGFLLIVLGLSACGGGNKTSQPDYNVSSSLASVTSSSASSSLSSRSSSSSFSSSSIQSSSSSSMSSSSSSTPAFLLTKGLVVDDSALPIEGALVTEVGTNQQVTTFADGTFNIELSTSTPAVLRVEKAGYSGTVKAAEATGLNPAIAARIVMLRVVSTQTFDPTQAAVLRVPGSPARVELAAGSLVREDGRAISGITTVGLTTIDPSADIARMPGLMVDAASGEPIESLGALSIEFTDASGAPLNLASGQTATIRIPATPAAGATLPDTFPLYHLNETTGLWKQEGTATLQADPVTGDKYYAGTVSHFSTWNADQPLTRSMVDFGATIGGSSCTVPIGARVVSQGVDYNGITAATGNNVFVRQNSQVRIFLIDRDGIAMDSVDLASTVAGSTVRMPRCLTVSPQVTLSGTVNVVSGSLTGERVILSGSKFPTQSVPIASDGAYSVSIYGNAGAITASLEPRLGGASVSATIAGANVVMPVLNLADTTVALTGCVQGWSGYRHSKAQVSLFKGATLIGQPTTLTSSTPNFSWTVPINSTYTVRITAPDATLVERSASAVVGNVPFSLGCMTLPAPPQALATVNGTGFDRGFDASGSVPGDAAISSYAWSFGDGTTGTGVSANHTYASVGSYNATLIITDALGQKSIPFTVSVDVTNGGTVSVPDDLDSPRISTGEIHTCAVTSSGAVKCWGFNSFGQLGNGSTTISTTPVDVTGLGSGVLAVSSGKYHSCAVTSSGAVKCWGYNTTGQLGNGSTTNSTTPVNVTGLGSGVLAISLKDYRSCALTSSGAVKCWGVNIASTQGNSSITTSTTPADVTGLSSGVVAIGTGFRHDCALTNSGAVKCWGLNSAGQLGNGSTTLSTTPVDVTGLGSGVVAISVGGTHSCAVTSSGAVKCWGFNSFGQLGNSSTTNSTSPVNVTGLGSGVLAISAGELHSCAVTSSGAVKCWGTNEYGQLGNNSTTSSTAPVDVTGLGANMVAVNSGQYHSCALSSSGTVKCWGYNEGGGLGNGSTTDSSTPVDVINFP